MAGISPLLFLLTLLSLLLLTQSPNPTSSRKKIVFAPGPAPTTAPARPIPTTTKHIDKIDNIVLGWLIPISVGVVPGLIIGAVLSNLWDMIVEKIGGGSKDNGLTIYSTLIKKSDLAFLEKEDAVASLQIIGKGGCGEVYKTQLPGSDRKMLAIKKIILPPEDAVEDSKKERQIEAEIKTIGYIRHKNIVPLLAHVKRANCHYLVYEFMKNGSLEDVLREVSHGSTKLEWLVRHKIALGIAAGLEYLHIENCQSIIHRDLKPANILIDDNMEARIADFGLAREIPDSDTHATASNLAGTVGYLAPEYAHTKQFTEKCDVYSFGVVLAVLVVGKFPLDDFFQHTNELTLIKWMRNIIASENPSHAIDPKLMDEGYEEQMLLVLKIASFCTTEDPRKRPNSKEIRCMLDEIKY